MKITCPYCGASDEYSLVNANVIFPVNSEDREFIGEEDITLCKHCFEFIVYEDGKWNPLSDRHLCACDEKQIRFMKLTQALARKDPNAINTLTKHSGRT